MTSLNLCQFGLGDLEMYNRNPALQDKEFERHGHVLLVMEGLMKDAIDLHCGKCRSQ